jgi:hypothetical protein
MKTRLKTGQKFPSLHTRNIHGVEVKIPASDLVHLQFRRFAGCPVCNLHLRAFVKRIDEIKQAGVHEVVIFHSSEKELLEYQGQFPFDVVGDPTKKFYKEYGVESSLLAILNPGAWGAMLKGNLAKDKPKMPMMPNGGPLGLPADFLIAADGTLRGAHYGRHADDNWSVDDVLTLARSSATVRNRREA